MQEENSKELNRQEDSSTVGLLDKLVARYQEGMAGRGIPDEHSATGLSQLETFKESAKAVIARGGVDLKPGLRWKDFVPDRPKLPKEIWDIWLLFHTVEDHIPGFASRYLKLLALEAGIDPDTDRPIGQIDEATYALYWSLLQFVLGVWVPEESTHADRTLFILLLAGEIAPEKIMQAEYKAGTLYYPAPSDNVPGLAAYTTVQEKQTWQTYLILARSTKIQENPIMKINLEIMARQEAGHAGFFSGLVRQAIKSGQKNVYGKIQESLQHFRMPLEEIEKYRETVSRFADLGNYTFEETFTWFAQQVLKAANSRTDSRDHPADQLFMSDEDQRLYDYAIKRGRRLDEAMRRARRMRLTTAS